MPLMNEGALTRNASLEAALGSGRLPAEMPSA
jgi:hypothetical protein